MDTLQTRGQRALIQMITLLIVAIGCAVYISIWKAELVREIYFADEKTYILNGIIILVFFLGNVQLIRGFHHYAFEERQVANFIQNREENYDEETYFVNVSRRSIIARRYLTIRSLYHHKVPISHGAISSIMMAEESLYQSFPKFVNNVLILTGVFGTITSLIFALVGASTVLQSSVPGEGMEVMLLGMNTALTTTATAIVCFFFFTYFYQKLTDVQTYLFGQIEKAVLIYIVPEFAFDSEAVNYKTDMLIKELREAVAEMKQTAVYIQESLTGLDNYKTDHIDKFETLLSKQDNQIQIAEYVMHQLEGVQNSLKAGFRLKE